MKPKEKLKLIMDIICKQKDLIELYETMIKEQQEKEIADFQCTVTLHFMGHWLTVTMDKIIMVDGKSITHPDNENIDLGFITISAMNATKEQIEMIHKENEEWYGNNFVAKYKI